ncbi:hypothetical protein MMC18_008887 [Xylographa bjoerkii]|nr:hypothetical protein [Xylographa bjoerkii]MCJ1395992.1 hypothetical protein [Xylographa bjoerkii]MCJ1396001.1 hypothetical protein [Xylographa bjoerkii]
MELSDPAKPATTNAPNRRKSARTVQKPISYQQDLNLTIGSTGSGKRKRGDITDVDIDADPLGDETSSDDNESDPDEEELKEQRRHAPKVQKAQNKPAAKKPKTTRPATTSLAMRPATNGVKKSSKSRKPRAKQNTTDPDETGLYADVFSGGQSTDEVAAEWISRYDDHNANAMCELVNFVLKCTGCDLQVDVHDIEDPDNVPSKLTDLQEEFQAQKITEYPLISKARSTTFSRAVMTDFFQSLVTSAHAKGLLYSDVALMENIQVWVTTMSSSGIRPFRHTATVLSLAVASALCGLMKEIVDNIATTTRQKESERKKKSVNKGRVSALQTKVGEMEKKKDLVESWLKDVFDTVFIHRYRDVDPKVRVDCSMALGTWISTCPDIFFEGQYLRYLGWVLSDVSAPTRAEVVKQLLRLYKNKDHVGRLRAFTEKFRSRMVEMATQDAEPTIRASVVELLDMMREVGLLEPDDVDTIGKLIFDSEPRVRKAVAGFFAENISDLFESTVEELGGDEVLDEALGESPEDDYDNPRKSWLKLKCLAEVLQSYDSNGDRESPAGDTAIDNGLVPTVLETRYAMAAQSICEGVPEVKEWEIVAGYLLYDHSSTLQSHDGDDPQTAFKVRCQLGEKEELLLLEVLNAAVKLRITEAIESEADKKGKKTKARKDESREIQESTAIHLAQVIPKLLGKFGSSPSTASAVLRLEHVLDLEVFQELRQDSTEFASLLDDINKQFLSHADHSVLAEARTALLHARSYEDLEEVTDAKVQELWEDTIGTLRELAKAKTPQFTSMANTIERISNLASISDCIGLFEDEPRTSTKVSTRADSTKVVDILIEVIKAYGNDEDAESASLVSSAMKSLLFYNMWIVRSLNEKIELNGRIDDPPNYENFSAAIQGIISSRQKLDDVRLGAVGTLLDLHTTYATLRHLLPPSGEKGERANARNVVASLVREVPQRVQDMILDSFLVAEKAYAQKAKRILDSPSEDDPPDDPDSELEDSSDDEDDGDDEEKARRSQHRQHELLVAEKRLCEFTGKIVLAILAKVLDASGSKKGALRKRLLRNKARLGPNFKEVLGYLDEPKPKRSRAKAKVAVRAAGNSKGAEKSKTTVTEEEDEDEEHYEVDEVVENEAEDLEGRELPEDVEDERLEEERASTNDAAEREEDEDDILGD